MTKYFNEDGTASDEVIRNAEATLKTYVSVGTLNKYVLTKHYEFTLRGILAGDQELYDYKNSSALEIEKHINALYAFSLFGVIAHDFGLDMMSPRSVIASELENNDYEWWSMDYYGTDILSGDLTGLFTASLYKMIYCDGSLLSKHLYDIDLQLIQDAYKLMMDKFYGYPDFRDIVIVGVEESNDFIHIHMYSNNGEYPDSETLNRFKHGTDLDELALQCIQENEDLDY